ncbi:MAG: thioredoxin-disulfide reductase [Clostridia bacterium]|nr:thioredoxin-disulfide reductase [Clostridia bacterium]
MDRIYDMVIIGGGPAGYTAALYATRAGFDTAVVERLSAGGQVALTGVIDNYPGFELGIDGFELGMKMQQGAERFGATTHYTEVLSVELSEKIKVVHTDSGVIKGKTLVIATGANPRELGLQREKELVGKGVHYCAHCDGRFYKDKTVVVIGGGNSAVSDALYLSNIAKKVILVHRRDTLTATKIYHDPLMKAQNVEFCWNSVVEQLVADQRVSGVVIRNVKDNTRTQIDCDGVFISIGRQPATAFLKDKLQLDNVGYIIADETTKTEIDGVFAAGDVRTKALRQIVTAVADGAVAVHYAEEYLNQSK